jgi:hypothetical protein
MARPPTPGRRSLPPPDYVSGEGPDELMALEDLAERLGYGTGS